METLGGGITILFVSGFALLGILSLTSFVKLSVVLMIIRQALGLQQVPSNMTIMALAAFLSIFISLPTISASFSAITSSGIDIKTVSLQELSNLWTLGIAPFQTFISNQTEPEHIQYFMVVSEKLWAGTGLQGTEDMLFLQIPAFMTSELTEAFKIGFLLYLPFVAIDLVVTSLLMALGMQMVQPNIIAVPFKLLVFVMVDGWVNLTEGLLLSSQAA
jgi:type III secretion protein R